jgi:AcrR family transcriptional regulator
MHTKSSLETYVRAALARDPVRNDPLDRKERVIAATLQACAGDGPLSLKVGEVAEAAGVSTASIYKDFANSDDMLSQAVLRGFDLLTADWPLDQKANDHRPAGCEHVISFLVKFSETYRDPYSNWMLRVDLATASTQNENVHLALVGFQRRIIDYGRSTLPRAWAAMAHTDDLMEILVGALQTQIIGSMLNGTVLDGNASSHNGLDIEKTIRDIVDWINVAPTHHNQLPLPLAGKAAEPAIQSKSIVQTSVEALLNTNFPRTDNVGRRHKMLAATMQHCSITGMEDANIAHIAKLAGVSTASVYREFPDKTALIKASIFHFLPVYAQATMQAVDEADPRLRLKKLLTAQALVLADPFGAWMFRYYVQMEAQQSDEMKVVAKSARAQSALFWNSQISRLQHEGYLVATNIDTTRNMIFGGVHRRCVMARVLHKDDAYVWSEIAASVDAAVDLLFRLYGTGRGETTGAEVVTQSDLTMAK